MRRTLHCRVIPVLTCTVKGTRASETLKLQKLCFPKDECVIARYGLFFFRDIKQLYIWSYYVICACLLTQCSSAADYFLRALRSNIHSTSDEGCRMKENRYRINSHGDRQSFIATNPIFGIRTIVMTCLAFRFKR